VKGRSGEDHGEEGKSVDGEWDARARWRGRNITKGGGVGHTGRGGDNHQAALNKTAGHNRRRIKERVGQEGLSESERAGSGKGGSEGMQVEQKRVRRGGSELGGGRGGAGGP